MADFKTASMLALDDDLATPCAQFDLLNVMSCGVCLFGDQDHAL
jgi:hypothetical protein